MGIAVNGKSMNGVAINGKTVSGIAYNGNVIYSGKVRGFIIKYGEGDNYTNTVKILTTDNPDIDLTNLTNKIKEINDAGTSLTMKVSSEEPLLNSCYRLFYKCDKIKTLDLSELNTANITSMATMFNGCANLVTINFGIDKLFKTTNVKDMSNVFMNCTKLLNIQDITEWDTSNVTNMINMFYSCEALQSLSLNKWNVKKVTNMGGMFQNCSSLTEIDVFWWETSSLVHMSYMFYNCKSLTNISRLADLGKVTNNSDLVGKNGALTTMRQLQDLGKGYVAKVNNHILYTLDLSETDLNPASLAAIVMGLYDLNETAIKGYKQTVVLGSTLSSRIGSQTKLELTNKGWTIA